jgi:threonine synthase
MKRLTENGSYSIPQEALEELQSLFYGGFADQEETTRAIRDVYEKFKYLMDPHTAVGYSVLGTYREESGDSVPTLLASTASPFKFNRAVLESLGKNISGKDEFSLLKELSFIAGQPVPPKLAELKTLPERHRGICRKEEMAETLYRVLNIK